MLSRHFRFAVLLAATLAAPGIAVAQQQTRPTPPPLPRADVAPNDATGKISLLSGSAGDLDILGVNGGFLRGTEQPGVGMGLGMSLIGMSGDLGGGGDLSAFAGGVSGNVVKELWGGAGKLYRLQGVSEEAVGTTSMMMRRRVPTISAFAGLGMNMLSATADVGTVDLSITGLSLIPQAGFQATFPIGEFVALDPFVMGQFSWNATTTSTTILGKTVTSTDTDTFFNPAYGADLIVMPFRNNPRWEISLGYLAALADSNDQEDQTLITLSLVFNYGPNYSSVHLAP